ncbi:MAG: hypothetical protein A2832_01530 [Candidatus Zambryskibacteria bacterium RIFCSPHIGHO2_01_FULL_44_22b]|uniref:Uncharacterized protein n=1 Tax=Candidatus Zambryskibacteria bacterium RIFCSPHIGHO2_01_FULL_44_22b TaxID=1802737 RepID=A0A1G2T3K8_9BACT|nr:MAG: hypothetical protein A2832_01530 [Candidatus Zambryskibacteria bacterium RIFCSPHIGHO2_01_FULL_44_22b]
MRRINTHKDQLILPFGQRKEMVISYENRLRVFWGLVTISIVSLLAYMYAINITARNIAHRASLEREITLISTGLDALEFEFIELRNNVTLELAYEKGFKEERSPLFVSRSNRAFLSFNSVSR